MNEQQLLKKILWVGGGVLALGLGYYFFYSLSGQQQIAKILHQPVVVREDLVIPDTESVAVSDTRSLTSTAYRVPLVPQHDGQKVVVENAVLTLKEAYGKALPEATIWSSDAKLVVIKSQGAVTLDGKSSQWQVVFGSKINKKGYEIVIQGDRSVSQKEIITDSYGYEVPKNWYDADLAIASLQTLPQFIDATVTGINFYHNNDNASWGYGLATSKGATAMPVR